MLATKVCGHMKSTRGWCLEGPNGMLTVIRDQSRYLSITNPDLQRNLLPTKQEIKLQPQCLKLKKKNNNTQIRSDNKHKRIKMNQKVLKSFHKFSLIQLSQLNSTNWFDNSRKASPQFTVVELVNGTISVHSRQLSWVFTHQFFAFCGVSSCVIFSIGQYWFILP